MSRILRAQSYDVEREVRRFCGRRPYGFGGGFRFGFSAIGFGKRDYPATLALTGWWRNYPGSVTWTGSNSTGVSGDGSHDITTLTGTVPNGTALNTHGTADFTGGSADSLRTTAALSSFLTTSAYSGWALIYFNDVTTSRQVLGTTGTAGTGGPEITVGSSLLTYTAGGSGASCSVSVTASTWHYIRFDWDGGSGVCNLQTNSGSNSGGGTNPTSLTGIFRLGDKTGSGTTSASMIVAEAGLMNWFWGTTEKDGIRDYLNEFYGLSLT